MVSYTTRHQLPYPTSGDPLSTIDNTMQSLAEALDEKLDIRRHSVTGLKHAKNLAYYEEGAPNLAGYVVIQTNLTFTNQMSRFDIRGYTYSASNNVIDLSITGYAYQPDDTFYSVDATNKGSAAWADIRLLKRTSDNKIAIALLPDTPSNLWQYPKMVVDAYVGHTEATSAELSGWSISRQANLNAYTFKKQALPAIWQAMPLVNGWVNYGDVWQPARFKKFGSVVHVEGLVRAGPASAGLGVLPEGFRPGAGKLIFPAQTDTGQGRVDVDSGGNVIHNGGGTAYFSISNIQFIAER